MLVDTSVMMQVQGLSPSNQALYNRYNTLRGMVEDAVKSYVKWPIEEDTLTDYYDGSGTKDIALRMPYVSAIANVWFDPNGAYGQAPSAFAAPPLVQGRDWALVFDDGTSVTGPRSKSGLLRKLTYYYPLFPSDLFFFRGTGGLSYTRPAWWPAGYGNTKVEYTFGFDCPTNCPKDIQLAVATAVSICANSARYGFNISSENLGAHSYSLDIQKPPEFGTVRQLLSRYRLMAIGF